MITGARLFAPEGYRSLVKGHYYHFLNSDAVHNRVRLVEFSDLAKDVRTTLITLTRFEFEEALEAGALLASGETEKFPPWLEPITGVLKGPPTGRFDSSPLGCSLRHLPPF